MKNILRKRVKQSWFVSSTKQCFDERTPPWRGRGLRECHEQVARVWEATRQRRCQGKCRWTRGDRCHVGIIGVGGCCGVAKTSVEPLGGRCDVNEGGADAAMSQGNLRFSRITTSLRQLCPSGPAPSHAVTRLTKGAGGRKVLIGDAREECLHRELRSVVQRTMSCSWGRMETCSWWKVRGVRCCDSGVFGVCLWRCAGSLSSFCYSLRPKSSQPLSCPSDPQPWPSLRCRTVRCCSPCARSYCVSEPWQSCSDPAPAGPPLVGSRACHSKVSSAS